MFPLEEDYGINSARSCINLHSRVFFNCIKKKLGAYYLIYAPEPRQLSKPRKTSDPDVGRMLKSMPASDFPTVWSNPSNIMFVQDFSEFVLFVAWFGLANRLHCGYCHSHESFLANASKWLRNNVLQVKQFLTPFHLPGI